MTRRSLSVIMITLNAERLLDRVLESVSWAHEIVVVDSGSTDRTEEIARRYTERFYVHEWPGEGVQRQRALDLATGDWVLVLDADEVVSPSLRAAIEEVMVHPPGDAAFKVTYHTYFLGHWFGRRGWRREKHIRLFRRGTWRFRPVLVHGGQDIEGTIGEIPGVILHYPYRDVSHFLEKMNLYSTWSARQMFERGRRCGVTASVTRGATHFVAHYIVRGGFLDGRAGLVSASLNAVYAFLKYAKLWEMGRQAQQPASAAAPRGEA